MKETLSLNESLVKNESKFEISNSDLARLKKFVKNIEFAKMVYSVPRLNITRSVMKRSTDVSETIMTNLTGYGECTCGLEDSEKIFWVCLCLNEINARVKKNPNLKPKILEAFKWISSNEFEKNAMIIKEPIPFYSGPIGDYKQCICDERMAYYLMVCSCPWWERNQRSVSEETEDLLAEIPSQQSNCSCLINEKPVYYQEEVKILKKLPSGTKSKRSADQVQCHCNLQPKNANITWWQKIDELDQLSDVFRDVIVVDIVSNEGQGKKLICFNDLFFEIFKQLLESNLHYKVSSFQYLFPFLCLIRTGS